MTGMVWYVLVLVPRSADRLLQTSTDTDLYRYSR